MAMSEEDKKQMTDMFADAMAQGLAKYRSALEEETAKANATGEKKEEKKDDTGAGEPFSLPGFLLGG